jgi:hypothetical protein
MRRAGLLVDRLTRLRFQAQGKPCP